MTAEKAEEQSAMVEHVVARDMAASRAATEEGEHFPEVLGTPHLIQKMKRAAVPVMRPMLGAGQVSVGVGVEIGHLVPTPVGAWLRNHARLTGRDGKLFWFDVWSEDRAGVVGRGRHSRAILDVAAIEGRAAARVARVA